MIVAVFRRRLKDGKSFEDFKQAWEAGQGFGAPTRVFNAVSLADHREVLSIGFVAVEPEALPAKNGLLIVSRPRWTPEAYRVVY